VSSRAKKRILFATVGVALIVSLVGLRLRTIWVESHAVNDGVVAFKLERYTDAVRMLTPVAARGNCIFSEFFNCSLRDPGVEGAQSTLALIYAFGLGVPRDATKAEQLFRRWQDGETVAGHPLSDTFLWVAQSYETGDNVPVDKQQALVWYRIAAEAGSKEARDHLKKLEGPS
jgi:TPR repeat protein